MKFTEEIVTLIKNYIILNVTENPNKITQQTSEYFDIATPTALKYVKELIKENIIERKGSNRYPNYQLVKTTHKWSYINNNLEEDLLWKNDVIPVLPELNNNVKDILFYGYTEMVNNVIDHSGATSLVVQLRTDALHIEILIYDNGIGIFKKIKSALGLEQSKHAILELAKGKFTSDPENHSGEGIFFTSRAFDYFKILSHKLSFYGFGNKDGVLWEEQDDFDGTGVFMQIAKTSKTQLTDIFNEYADPDKDPSFHKTLIPVKLMEHEGDALISRSQAKRLINRFDRFTEVVLDFDGVTQIGQAFADQIFRVFHNKHPEVHILVINTTKEVENMIKRVQSTK